MKNNIKFVLKKVKEKILKYKFIVMGFLFLFATGLIISGIVMLPKAFSQPVRDVKLFSEKLNYENKEPGAWNVTKTAEWTGEGKARITFNVDSIIKGNESNNTDLLFVLDVSNSMNNNRLERLKENVSELVKSLLKNDKNRVGIITFSDSSDIESDFTSDQTLLLQKINGLGAWGNTNYYQALVNVDNVLKGYKKEENRECVILFLTDGSPNKETPNEVAQFSYLKKKYPFITVNGIQYEMGSKVLDQIKNVSDNQYIATTDTLNNTLFEAAGISEAYEKFNVVDYIGDNFDINSVNQVKASKGTVDLEKEGNTSKIIWSLDDSLRSGLEASMTIDIDLKSEFLNTGGSYLTNKKVEVSSKIDSNEENIFSNDSPILRDDYVVEYDGNAPSDCTIVGDVPTTKQHSVFTSVDISDANLKCDGYQFKGWELTTADVKRVNKDYFTMPEKNVKLRAKWSKLAISKKMDGSIHEAQRLYQVIAEKAVPDNVASEFVSSTTGINFSNSPSDTNGKGVYQLANTKDNEFPVYYYRGAVEDNNAVFGGFCWKIVRTTDTGGVKLLYNGTPDSNGECNNTGADSQIGESTYMDSPGTVHYLTDFSMADIGYMQGTRHLFNPNKDLSLIGMSGKEYDWFSSDYDPDTNQSTNYYYADTVTYSNGKYTLKNPVKIDAGAEDFYYADIVKKYTCLSSTLTSCDSVKYVYTRWAYDQYRYIDMIGGETLDTIISKIGKIVYGTDVSYSNGSYRLLDTVAVSPSEYDDYTKANYLGDHHYTCFTTGVSCSTVYYMYNTYAMNSDLDEASTQYLSLTNGKKLEDIKSEMLSNNSDSLIKKSVDAWYSKNLNPYTNYLEDTVWCNDRTISSGALKSEDTFSYVSSFSPRQMFGAWNVSPLNITTTCPEKNDSFTVSAEKGNGKLTYPVGLITGEEAAMAGFNKTSYLFTGKTWLTMSPYELSPWPRISTIGANAGNYDTATSYGSAGEVYSYYGVRPSISLVANVKVDSGNGTVINPYVIETSNVKDYDIKVNGNEDIKPSSLTAAKGVSITLKSKSGNYEVRSFKMNGNLIEGNSFTMPDEDVVITDINTVYVIESDHGYYSFAYNNNKVYGEKTFDGATSLNVTLDYQTQDAEKLYIYDSTNKSYGPYSGPTRKTVTMTIPGNYIKFVVNYTGSYNSYYYGFKVTVVPNY